jgi:hypothetical protein
MSSSHRAPIFWVGLDVHKDSVTAAVFRNRDPEPQRGRSPAPIVGLTGNACVPILVTVVTDTGTR